MRVLRRHLLPRAVSCACAGLCCAGTLPPALRAQSLEEVVVTAQRREQALQEVPVALQVMGADRLADIAAEDLGDVGTFVPGLDVESDSPTQPRFAIRGIYTDDFGIGTDSAVGVYVDGVYSSRSGASLLAFNDVERVEVLKGPQGTLFGRNSAAGAISIVTRQPAPDFDAFLKLRVGEYAKRRVEGMVNVPLGDAWALRVNGLYNESDGWVEDAATGRDLWPEQNWALRSALRWTAGEDTAATLTWDRDEIDQLARPAFGVIPVSAGSPPPFPPEPATYVDPRRAPVLNDVAGNEESRQFDRLTLAIDVELGWAAFHSITAWRRFDTVNREDEDGTNRIATYFDTANVEDNESWYQEFRLEGTRGAVDWIAGVSAYDEDARQASQTNAYTDSVDTTLVNVAPFATPDGSLFGYTSAVLADAGSDVTLLGLPWRETMYNEGEFRAFAVYGDAIWHATDRLNLTAGLRYTHDAKEFAWLNGPREAPELDARLDALEADGFFDTFPIPPEDYRFDLVFPLPPGLEGRRVRRSDSWDDLSPRLVVDYEWKPGILFFTSLAKGYKAGGYNSVEVGSHFDNEDVWNLETGVKSVWARVGLAFNASLYAYRYDDRQSISLVQDVDGSGVPRYVVDTSDEEAFGLDAELRWQPYEEVTLYANLALIDATYRNRRGLDGQDLSGQPTGEPYANLALGASYVWLLGPRGLVDLSAQFAYRGETRCSDEAQVQGDCLAAQAFRVGEPQTRTDTRLAWKDARDVWGAAVFVNNVFDEQYVTRLDNLTADTLGTPFASLSPPRAWGLEVWRSF
ncbi:MAG: TonB-dependent receptor [Lysobacterales bacterium]|nr:MAG: TonB-dependent receptor [Xanthomonadales bacterium]